MTIMAGVPCSLKTTGITLPSPSRGEIWVIKVNIRPSPSLENPIWRTKVNMRELV